MTLRLVLPVSVLALLAACASPGRDAAKPQAAITPTQQFELKATEKPDEVRLAAHAGGLSQAQIDALSDLAGRWLAGRQPEVTIQEPVRGADPGAVDATGFAAKALLVSLGVPAERVRQAGYEPSGDGAAPLIVGFKAYQAEVPKCGQSFARMDADTSNMPMANFGCAVTADMAAQIADPADIVSPRHIEPALTDRRTFVLDQYRQGKPSSSTADTQASGAVSSSGGSSSSGSGGS